MSDLDELFARAREADIEAVAGTPLFRAGRRMRGECPLCHASKGKEGGGAFSVDPQARVFKCFGCDEGGDVIDLEQQLRGGTPKEAAERLAGMPVPASPRERPRFEPRRAEGEKRLSGPERIAAEILRGARRDILGTPVAAYLLGRGISPGLVEHLAGGWLRYHPAAKWAFDPERGEWLCAPAMVGRVIGHDGPTGGVHVTYLKPDGSGKAALDPAKRMWGPQKDAQGRPGGVWLTSPLARGPLIVAEGIESALSAAELVGWPCRLVATLSLGALQGGWLADAWGRIDPSCLAGDPARPAFVWDEPTTRPWGEVMIAVDRDMSPIEVKVRAVGGGTARRRLEGEERARICAGLAVQAWKRAGANAVRAIAPGAGRDFNDELRERVGA